MPSRVATLSVLALSIPSAAFAGPLDPPPGAVAPTGRFGPRVEINATNTPGDADSVYRIMAPGSYYLSGNVTGEAGNMGIEVASDNVSIDLGGFVLAGVPGSLDGISDDPMAPSTPSGIVIENGFIRGWGDRGIGLLVFNSVRVRHLIVTDNGRTGVSLGLDAHVEACMFVNNGHRGLEVIYGVVVGSQADGNTDTGFVIGEGRVTDCIARENGDGGFIITKGAVVNSHAIANSIFGFDLAEGSVAHDCTAEANIGVGFDAFGCMLIGCESSRNTMQGFVASLGCHLRGCIAIANSLDGFLVTFGCTVQQSTSYMNATDGIEAGDDCSVIGCTASSNGLSTVGTAGIRLSGANGLAEGNHVTNNRSGIRVTGMDNLVVRNRAAGNLVNYDIPGANAFGPIVAVGGIGDITGALGPDDHPAANYSY